MAHHKKTRQSTTAGFVRLVIFLVVNTCSHQSLKDVAIFLMAGLPKTTVHLGKLNAARRLRKPMGIGFIVITKPQLTSGDRARSG
jgi:hypothetical protein